MNTPATALRELSLFTGAGGGILGTTLLGWNHVGYVELDEYCQRVLAQRIKDGLLDEAPIFGDVRAFIRDGYAASYQGMVDVLSAGFPCQPFSCAGQRKGGDDDRNMWPETVECIRIVRPRFALLENVAGLLAHGYIHTIFRELAESGYSARWRILSAAEVGAPHKRDRLWIVVADTKGFRWNEGRFSEQKTAFKESKRLVQGKIWNESPEAVFLRVAHGIPSRVDRLRALGNGQVPLVAATVWRLLTSDE